MLLWRAAISPKTCFACASLGLKDGLLVIAQTRGENRFMMKSSKPGSVGWGLESGRTPFGSLWVRLTTSGPPQTLTIRLRTWKVIFAVGKSFPSFAKCSRVEITVSKTGWLAVVMLARPKMIVEGRRLHTRTHKH